MERSAFVIQLQREAIYRKLCVFFVEIENSPLLAILAHFSDRKRSLLTSTCIKFLTSVTLSPTTHEARLGLALCMLYYPQSSLHSTGIQKAHICM